MQINWEEQLGSEAHLTAQDSSVGKESLKTSGCENQWGGVLVGETPRLTGEFTGETYVVLEHTETHPPGYQHHKGPICFWVAREVTESWPRAEQRALFPLGPLLHTVPQCSEVGHPALVNT